MSSKCPCWYHTSLGHKILLKASEDLRNIELELVAIFCFARVGLLISSDTMIGERICCLLQVDVRKKLPALVYYKH